ncbi:MAG: DUF192 domain-containing protein [Patescibacteria group bacterium]
MKNLTRRQQPIIRSVVAVQKLQPKDRGILKGNYLVAFCCGVIIFSLAELAFVAAASIGKRERAARSQNPSPLEVRKVGGGSNHAFVATEPFVMAPPSRAKVTIGSATFEVELARTELERRKGLSGRQSLPEGTGLLFYFPQSGSPWFWMKDMNFPIDIIWIGEDRTVVSVHSGVAPESYPTVYTPSSPTQFVLEVPAGNAHRAGIKKGARVTLPAL